MKSLYDKMSISARRSPQAITASITANRSYALAYLVHAMRFSHRLFPPSASLVYRKDCRTNLGVEDGVRSSLQRGRLHG